MIPLFGSTRTHVAARHALLTPDGHVPSLLPFSHKVRGYAHISPALGAGFSQSTLQYEAGGSLRYPASEREAFFYVNAGTVQIKTSHEEKKLAVGDFFFLAPQEEAEVSSLGEARVTVFEKRYQPLPSVSPPRSFGGETKTVAGQPFLGNPKTLLQVLLPETPSFDMAVNLFTYQPGATLPFVETHIMEHGLLMLAGQGIYRLEESWYPVQAGDVIWMAPYCPQWFVALGDEPAAYLYYKDVNRPFLSL